MVQTSPVKEVNGCHFANLHELQKTNCQNEKNEIMLSTAKQLDIFYYEIMFSFYSIVLSGCLDVSYIV